MSNTAYRYNTAWHERCVPSLNELDYFSQVQVPGEYPEKGHVRQIHADVLALLRSSEKGMTKEEVASALRAPSKNKAKYIYFVLYRLERGGVLKLSRNVYTFKESNGEFSLRFPKFAKGEKRPEF